MPPAVKRTLWQLRYRSPLSPTKGVDDVLIETNTTLESDARRVAEHWLATRRASPSTRFVYVRPAVVMTQDQMEEELTKPAQPAAEPDDLGGPSPAQAASRDETANTERRTAPGRIGA